MADDRNSDLFAPQRSLIELIVTHADAGNLDKTKAATELQDIGMQAFRLAKRACRKAKEYRES